MTQSLEAKVCVVIPEEYVLITKVEYEELKKAEAKGEIGDLKWFKDQVGIKDDNKVKTEILYPNRKDLEPFVKFADGSGSRWLFHKNRTKEWIENNFDKIVGR